MLNFSTYNKSKKTFTLIELLTVIAMLGIIAAMAFNMTNSARKRARDTVRLGNIYSIKHSLESFRIDNGRYPRPNTNWESFTYFNGNTVGFQADPWDGVAWSVYQQDSTQLANHIDSYTKDPTLGTYYYWTMSNTPANAKWQDYTLFVALEVKTHGTSPGTNLSGTTLVTHEGSVNLEKYFICRTGENMGDVISGTAEPGTVLDSTVLPVCSGI